MKVSFKVMARAFAVMGLAGVLSTAVTMESAAKVPTEVEIVTNNEDTMEVSIEASEVEIVASPMLEIPEPKLTEEQLAWQNSLMAKVEDSLNVRAEASEEAEVVGSLYKGSKAEVLEVGSEWTKIKSANVEGFVKNGYCVYGAEALTYAKEVCDTMATVTADTLRVREEMNTESKIAEVLDEGDSIKVDTSAVTEEGWVAVVCDSKTCYVSAEYVTVEMKTVKALTVEEQEEIRRAEEEAKRKAEEAKKAKQSATRTQGQAVSASVDEVTLLAAIIQCEAGGESYEGQVAVGAVVMNRVKSSRFPNTIEGVIYQKGQFTPVKSGALAKRLSGTIKQSCYDAAREALAGVDNTGGALYFRMKNLGRTGLEIGCHVFYK
uniref:cell wall hydrolase n=1 Tax=Agathobacter sp. TaxID=2021311 RepID=UPI004057A25C